MGPLTSALSDPATLTTLPGRTFVSPARYVQGPGMLDELGAHLAPRHRRAVVLVDRILTDQLEHRVAMSLSGAGLGAEVVAVDGEVTVQRIDALAQSARSWLAESQPPTVVVGVGGGKTLDTAKGVAKELDLAFVSVPTIASNDGPTSRVIALYDDRHVLVETPHLPLNPELVLVDTALLAAAPPQFLRAGIGDALAKFYEARACLRADGRATTGQRPLHLAGVVAGACLDVLQTDAANALAAARAQRVDEPFERVTEAVLLLSGMSFENGGLSLAHALTRGLMATPGADQHLHGYHVAYGLLVQLAHEDDDELSLVRKLLIDLGLPVSLADLDAEATSSRVLALAEAVMGSPHTHNCVPYPTVDSLIDAIGVVERAAQSHRTQPVQQEAR